MSAPQMTAREWGLLILLSFLWGGAFFFAAVALKEVTPHALVFFRVVIASLALGVAGLAMGVTFPRELAVWRRVAVLGLFSTAMPFMLLYWAQTHIASGLAAILNAMTPIFTILVAHLFTRDEKIDARRLIGVLAGVAGVAVIVGPSAVSHLAGGNLLAEAAVLGAAFCYAVASVYGRRFQTQSPIVLSFGQMVAGSVYLLPVMLIAGAPFRVATPSLVTIGAVLALGTVSTALAFGIFFFILRRAGATNAVLVTLLVPVSAILLGVLILGETIASRQFAGLALIASGLMIIDGRVIQFLRDRYAGAGLVQRPEASSLAVDDKRPLLSGSASRHMLNEPHHLQ